MYHQSIQIRFHNSESNPIFFEYKFWISKLSDNPIELFGDNYENQTVEYQELLDKFESLGFNVKFLNFPDIKDKSTKVWCDYNGTTNFQIFFKAYDKILKNSLFDIDFEYGNIIKSSSGSLTFVPNNMNSAATISYIFVNKKDYSFTYEESLIKGRTFLKTEEVYQIVDSNGKVVKELNIKSNFGEIPDSIKDEFFQDPAVALYLRSYKLKELKQNLQF